MRSTQELRREIFRRAEQKRMATRRLYRRMGTLCVMLCLCTGVMVWGMLGQTAPEENTSFSRQEESHSVLEGDDSLILAPEDARPGGVLSGESALPPETQESNPMADFEEEESVSHGLDTIPSEESDTEPPEAPPGVSDEEPDSPSGEELPTIVLLKLPTQAEANGNLLCTVQGILSTEGKEPAPGEMLEVKMPAFQDLPDYRGILAAGEWQGSVFVIDHLQDCFFLREQEHDSESSPDSGEETPDCEIDEDPPPPSSDEGESEIFEILVSQTGLPVSGRFLFVEEGEALFEALKDLYQ